MTSRVFLHIGLPKTGTTYLQTVLWANREKLENSGIRLPGRERRDHLWASRFWRDQPGDAADTARWEAAWDRIHEDLRTWPGPAIISHEFFAAASADQAEALLAALAPAEVHLIVTAREPVSLFTSSWQESLKNRHTDSMADYSQTPVSEKPTAIWNWRTLDIRLVLERWAPTLDPRHVHVLPVPPRPAPPTLLWERFAQLIGIDATDFDLSVAESNESLGAAEAETLRQINSHFAPDAFVNSFDRGVYIRTLLAHKHLTPRRGDRFWPAPETIDLCRTRANDAVAAIRAAEYDVVGNLDDLIPPAHLEERRTVESVTEAEVIDVAATLAGELLEDIQRLTLERNSLRRELRRALENPPLRAALVNRYPWMRRFLG